MSDAPKTIYLQDAGDYAKAAELEVTWCVEPQDDADTPYVRTDLADALAAALRGAIGALEFSRDYHADLGNEDQAFAQDKLDAATAALAAWEARK